MSTFGGGGAAARQFLWSVMVNSCEHLAGMGLKPAPLWNAAAWQLSPVYTWEFKSFPIFAQQREEHTDSAAGILYQAGSEHSA